MRIFVDTSAFFALLDRDDANHKKAKEIMNVYSVKTSFPHSPFLRGRVP